MIQFKKINQLRCDLVSRTELVNSSSTPDLIPVSAARVSHGREDKTGRDPERDEKLMAYLVEHEHFSPFEHQHATFLVEAPLFVAREWMRHRTQSFNEISMRYTDDPSNTYWEPDSWRAQSIKSKQGSAGELLPQIQEQVCAEYRGGVRASVVHYNNMLQMGCSRELARAILPVGMVTRYYATANLRNWYQWYRLRSTEDAQEEIRYYAGRIDIALSETYPKSWAALRNAK